MCGVFLKLASGPFIPTLLVGFLACMPPVAAQSQDVPAQSPSGQRETIIGGQPPPTIQRCIEVEIGGDREFGCLNQQLKREVERVNPTLNLPPIDARSSDIRVGNVNEAAIRQQYGPNYGRSTVPFRPTLPSVPVPPRR
jgi:hypothetical protein